MKRLLFLALFASAALAADKPQGPDVRPNGLYLNTAADQPLSFYGADPIVRRGGADQTALTDSTGGSVSNATLASTAGISVLSVPIQLSSMTTSAADLVTEILPGYRFKVLAVDFVTTTLGTGSGASQTINLEIGTTNLTGGVVNPTLSSTNTLGKVTSGTSVTANNTGTATDVLSVEVAASGTVFTGGAGFLVIRLQNMDVQDNAAKTAELVNELRASLVALGAITGS